MHVITNVEGLKGTEEHNKIRRSSEKYKISITHIYTFNVLGNYLQTKWRWAAAGLILHTHWVTPERQTQAADCMFSLYSWDANVTLLKCSFSRYHSAVYGFRNHSQFTHVVSASPFCSSSTKKADQPRIRIYHLVTLDTFGWPGSDSRPFQDFSIIITKIINCLTFFWYSNSTNKVGWKLAKCIWWMKLLFGCLSEWHFTVTCCPAASPAAVRSAPRCC